MIEVWALFLKLVYEAGIDELVHVYLPNGGV